MELVDIDAIDLNERSLDTYVSERQRYSGKMLLFGKHYPIPLPRHMQHTFAGRSLFIPYSSPALWLLEEICSNRVQLMGGIEPPFSA